MNTMKINLSIKLCFSLLLLLFIINSCSNTKSNSEVNKSPQKLNIDSLFYKDADNHLELSDINNLQKIKGFKSVKLGLHKDSVLWITVYKYGDNDKYMINHRYNNGWGWKIDTISAEKGIYIFNRSWNNYTNPNYKNPEINGIPIYYTTLTFVKDTLTSIKLDFRDAGGASQGYMDELSTQEKEEYTRKNMTDNGLKTILLSALGNPITDENDLSELKKVIPKASIKTFGASTYKKNGNTYKISLFSYPLQSYDSAYWVSNSIYLYHNFYYYRSNSTMSFSDDIGLDHWFHQTYKIGYLNIDEIVSQEKIKKEKTEQIKEEERKAKERQEHEKRMNELREKQINKL